MIAAAIDADAGSTLGAHGQAGVGNTTTLRQPPRHLPAGTVPTLFDRYGAGEYLNAGERQTTRSIVGRVYVVDPGCGAVCPAAAGTMVEVE